MIVKLNEGQISSTLISAGFHVMLPFEYSDKGDH